MTVPLLEFREVDVFYGPIQALHKVSLQVNEGETVALIGANGAGKSSLLMSIFGTTMTGSTSTRLRSISKLALPDPMMMAARSSVTGTGPAASTAAATR